MCATPGDRFRPLKKQHHILTLQKFNGHFFAVMVICRSSSGFFREKSTINESVNRHFCRKMTKNVPSLSIRYYLIKFVRIKTDSTFLPNPPDRRKGSQRGLLVKNFLYQ
jgi:hypothetical protein